MKRYDSYKDSGVEWIGEIPKGWKTPRLKHSIDQTFGGEVIDKSYWGEGPETLYTTSKKIHQSDYPNFNDERRTTKKDLLLSRNGDGIVHIPDDGSIYTNVVQLVRIKQEVDRRFLWYSLTFQIKPLNSYSDGDFIVSLNKEQWFNLLTPLPLLNEQQQIVSFLDIKTSLIDSLIEKTQRKIELLKEKRTSLINEVVTKGLNPNVEMKDSGVEWIGSVPIDFEILPVKYVSQLLRGKFSHRPRNDERYYGGKYPFIQTGDIVSSGKYITNFNDTLNELGYSVSKEFPIDTLVMVITGHNTGKVSILKIVSCFPDSIIGFSPNNKTSEEYLYFIFLTLIEELQKTSIKSTQMNLNIDRVGNIKIPLPSISQQKEIIKFINKENILIDKTISVEEKRIKLLKEYRQSLISEVVTGKRKVVEDNYPIIKNSLSVTLPYKILNPKYEKKVFKTSSGETITTQTGEEYLKPKKELIDFLNKELSNLVTTKNQKDSIERFFKESFFRLKHSLPFKGSYEHKDWNILKGKDGSILSNYYFTSGIMEDMKPNWERFIFKLNGEIDEFTDNIHEDNFIEKFRIYR